MHRVLRHREHGVMYYIIPSLCQWFYNLHTAWTLMNWHNFAACACTCVCVSARRKTFNPNLILNACTKRAKLISNYISLSSLFVVFVAVIIIIVIILTFQASWKGHFSNSFAFIRETKNTNEFEFSRRALESNNMCLCSWWFHSY